MRTRRHFRTLVLASLCMILLVMPGMIFGRIIYVGDDAAGAQAGDEIRVAQGTYYPDDGAGRQKGNRQACFVVPSGVMLKGGFGGGWPVDLNECDPIRFASILSGGLCIAANHAIVDAIRCLFVGNPARDGGCLYLASGSGAYLGNCVCVGNRADWSGGVMARLALGCQSPIISSIFWNNEAQMGSQVYLEQSTVLVRYSDIQGGEAGVRGGNTEGVWSLGWGDGNIDGDPRFVDAGHWGKDAFIPGDYHLPSEGGRWHPGTQSWVQDRSPVHASMPATGRTASGTNRPPTAASSIWEFTAARPGRANLPRPHSPPRAIDRCQDRPTNPAVQE